jgi:hypothetical protein
MPARSRRALLRTLLALPGGALLGRAAPRPADSWRSPGRRRAHGAERGHRQRRAAGADDTEARLAYLRWLA